MVDVFRKGKFELFVLSERECCMCGLNGIIASVQGIGKDR